MRNDDHNVNRQKINLLTGIGCYFWIVILGGIVILVFVLAWNPAKAILFSPEEIQLKVSHSPNQKNKIEIVRIEDFPDPTLRINYNNTYVTKTKLPDKITVEWKNDDKADVILTKQGREPDIVEVEFK